MNEETRNRLIGEDQAEKWEQGYNTAVTDYKARLLAKLEELGQEDLRVYGHDMSLDYRETLKEVCKIIEEL